MNNIRFSHNWNLKLNQQIFTTIRKYDYKKWNYYKGQEDTEFNVLLNGKLHCKATLINAEYLNFNSIPKGLICTDTGMNFKEARKLFRTFGITEQSSVIVLTLKGE